MELRQLRYFVKTAELLNFSEAARELNVAQSTLSQQVRQLENELNIRLFDRNSHEIVLTEAAREILPFALKTIKDADNCVSKIQDLSGLSSCGVQMDHPGRIVFANRLQAGAGFRGWCNGQHGGGSFQRRHVS